MKAIIWTAYGPPGVLKPGEKPKPIPGDNEILIKVHAATVTLGDCEVRSLKLPLLFKIIFRLYMGLRKPKNKTPGQELAGTIEAVGKQVKAFKPGDEVFAPSTMNFGAYAEYICLPVKHPIVKKSEKLSFEEAATIPTGGLNGLHFIRKVKIQQGDKVLINGAGGSIGTYAVQLAKLRGAEITAVDSDIKLDMLQSIGADLVIDYKKEDFTNGSNKYDVIIDIVGNSSFFGSLRVLNQKGRYVLGNPNISGAMKGMFVNLFSGKRVIPALAPYKTEDLKYLQELIETSKIKPVIDKHFPLSQTAQAHEYVEKGLKVGNVIINIT